MSTTGEHAAVPEAKATFEQDAKGLWGRVFTPTARVVIASLLVGGAGATGTYALAQSEFSKSEAKSAARVDAGVAGVRSELLELKVETTRRIDSIERKQDQAEERSARRFEALYNAMLTGRPQPGAEELKQPATDGGR